MMKPITNYPLVEQTRSLETFRTPKNLILKLLIFYLVFNIGSVLQSFILMPAMIPKILRWSTEKFSNGESIDSQEAMDFIMNMMNDSSLTILMLFSTVLVTAAILLFCKLVEGRNLASLGFTKKGALKQYLLGLGVGFVMFSLVVGLSWAMGGLTANGLAGGSVLGILLAFLGFGLQGMSEEVTCRGYLMTTILRHQKPWVAVVVNAAIFALLHMSNNGVSLLAILNLTLCGVMFSLYMLRTNNLWGACAIHSIWNFVQGNFYGLPVSGINSGDSVFTFSLVDSKDIINGGAFGLEAGLPCTIVLTAVILILLFVPFGKKSEEASA